MAKKLARRKSSARPATKVVTNSKKTAKSVPRARGGRTTNRETRTTKHEPRTTARPAASSARGKYVYFFGSGKAEGDRTMKDLLGGKGSGLAEMTNAGLPVPAGFTITTEACTQYYQQGGKTPDMVDKQ